MASFSMDQIWRPLFDKYDYHKRGIISVVNFPRIIDESRLYKQNCLTVCGNSDDNGTAEPGYQFAIPTVHRVLWSRIAQKDGNKMINYEEFLQMIADLELYNSPPVCYVVQVDYTSSSLVPKAERQSFVRCRLSQYNGLWRETPFILLATLLESIIFLYYCLFHWTDWKEATLTSPLVYQLWARQQVWRLVSAVLMHNGFLHIIMNMLSQLYVGVPLELVHGWWRVAVIYLVGAIGGSFAGSLTGTVVGLGASGAVYALFGAYFANLAIIWHNVTSPVTRMVLLLLSALVQIILEVISDYLFTLNIGHWCHFGGAHRLPHWSNSALFIWCHSVCWSGSLSMDHIARLCDSLCICHWLQCVPLLL